MSETRADKKRRMVMRSEEYEYQPIVLDYAGSNPHPINWMTLFSYAACGWAFLSIAVAWNYGDVYIRSLGSWCGTPEALAASLIWLVAFPGLLFSAAAFVAAMFQRISVRVVIRLGIAIMAQLTCLIVPSLWRMKWG